MKAGKTGQKRIEKSKQGYPRVSKMFLFFFERKRIFKDSWNFDPEDCFFTILDSRKQTKWKVEIFIWIQTFLSYPANSFSFLQRRGRTARYTLYFCCFLSIACRAVLILLLVLNLKLFFIFFQSTLGSLGFYNINSYWIT